MNQEKKLKREKRVYDEAFRREAVALLQSSDEPLSQIATKLGVMGTDEAVAAPGVLIDTISITGASCP